MDSILKISSLNLLIAPVQVPHSYIMSGHVLTGGLNSINDTTLQTCSPHDKYVVVPADKAPNNNVECVNHIA